MKKTLVALSVLAAASAQAGIELYNQDNVSVTLGGDLEVVYIDNKDFDKTNELKQELQDADFSFDVRYAATDSFSVGAFWEFSGDKGQADTGNAYFGFYSDNMGSLKVGKLDTILDDAGIGNDYQFGVSDFFDNADFGGTESVRYDFDNGTIYAGLGFSQNKANTKNFYGEDGSLVDARIGGRVAGFDLVAYVGQAKSKGDTVKGGYADGDKVKLAAFEVTYALDAVNLQAGYYDISHTGTFVNTKGGKTLALAADYTMEAWNFAAGVDKTDFEAANTDDATTGFVNVSYGIAPNTKLYAEYGFTNEDNKDNGYAVGIKADF